MFYSSCNISLFFLVPFLILALGIIANAQPRSAYTDGGSISRNFDSNTVQDENNFGSLSGRVTANAESGANLSGIRVVIRRLDGGLGNFVFDRVTGGRGEFQFKYLRPGRYQIEIDRKTIPPSLTNTARCTTEITIGYDKETVVELAVPSVSPISGVIYLDTDHDGRFDSKKDRRIAGAYVSVDRYMVMTAGDGSYFFSEVPTGRKLLSVELPSGEKTSVAFDLAGGRMPRIIDVGTDDENRRPVQPTVSARAKDEAAYQSVPSGPVQARLAAPYNTSALTGEAYAAKTGASRKGQLVAANVQPAPADMPLRRSPVASSAALSSSSSAGHSKGLKGYSTGDAQVDGYIVDSSKRFGIDPLLIFAQMGQESSYKSRAVSPKGASGLMQLMPATARRMGVDDIFDPKQNIEGGVKYMRLLMNMFDGDVRLALAGYNAGEGAVVRYGYQVPPYSETQEYVRRISAKYRALRGGNNRGAEFAGSVRSSSIDENEGSLP